jgi:hypothetical protein
MFAGTRIPHLRRQKSLLTLPQQALYKTLIRAVGPETLIVLTRINLGHLVQRPNDNPNYRAHWQYISNQWIDFVLCNPAGFTPVLAIKLETRAERRQRLERARTHPNERDTTEEILSGAKIPLLRLMAVNDYDFAPVMNEIRRLLFSVLANEKQNNLMRQPDTGEIYIKDLDGEIDKSPGERAPPTPFTRSGR